jgi:hypothetical protein
MGDVIYIKDYLERNPQKRPENRQKTLFGCDNQALGDAQVIPLLYFRCLGFGPNDKHREKKAIESLENRLRTAFFYEELGDVAELGETIHSLDNRNLTGIVGLAFKKYNAGNCKEAIKHVNFVLGQDHRNKDALLAKLYFIEMLDGTDVFSYEEAENTVWKAFDAHPKAEDILENLLVVAINIFKDADMADKFYESAIGLDKQKFKVFKEGIGNLRQKPEIYSVK